jgi:hypothetical protein
MFTICTYDEKKHTGKMEETVKKQITDWNTNTKKPSDVFA